MRNLVHGRTVGCGAELTVIGTAAAAATLTVLTIILLLWEVLLTLAASDGADTVGSRHVARQELVRPARQNA